MLHRRVRCDAAVRALPPRQPPGVDVELCLRYLHGIPHVQAIRHTRAIGHRAMVWSLAHHRFLVHLHLHFDDRLNATLGRDGHLTVEQAVCRFTHLGGIGIVWRKAELRGIDGHRVGTSGLGVGGRWERTNR